MATYKVIADPEEQELLYEAGLLWYTHGNTYNGEHYLADSGHKSPKTCNRNGVFPTCYIKLEE